MPRYAAVGLLELLWHYTAEFAPRGGVGKYSDAAIARACHWRKDPEVFVSALVETGWLDRDEEYRLIVHDWSDHVDETTKKRLLRAKQELIVREPNGNRTGTERQTEVTPTAANGSLARGIGKARQGLDGQGTEQNAVPPFTPGEFDLENWFEARYILHPKKKNRAAALRYLSELPVQDPAWRAEFERVHNLWVAQSSWLWKGGAGAPDLGQWILDKGWKYEPEKTKTELTVLEKALRVKNEEGQY